MSDVSPAETTIGLSVLGDAEAAKPALTMTGYCAECGTWDAHGPSCSSCGYDFAGTTAPAPGY